MQHFVSLIFILLVTLVHLKQISLYKHNRHGDQSDTLRIFFQEDLFNIVRFIVLPIFIQTVHRTPALYIT